MRIGVSQRIASCPLKIGKYHLMRNEAMMLYAIFIYFSGLLMALFRDASRLVFFWDVVGGFALVKSFDIMPIAQSLLLNDFA